MKSLRSGSISALTRIELLVTIACAVLAVTLLLCGLTSARRPRPALYCANNLKQIGLSSWSWTLDNNGHFPMQVSVTNGGTRELVASGLVFPHFQVMCNELSTTKILVCPADRKRTPATNFVSDLSEAKISYFINVDSVVGNGSSLLCGDRNLKNKPLAASRFVCLGGNSVIGWDKQMHREKGNVSFADARVATLTNGALASALRMPAGVTNRLAVP
jgi:hypothetical protein